MVDNSIYQYMFDEISKYLLNDWERAVVYLEYGQNSYSITFYEKCNGEYINCYNLPEVSECDLELTFRNIDKRISEARKSVNDQLWTNMTMVVTSDGNMHSDIDYTDLSKGSYQHKKNWKAKYLK